MERGREWEGWCVEQECGQQYKRRERPRGDGQAVNNEVTEGEQRWERAKRIMKGIDTEWRNTKKNINGCERRKEKTSKECPGCRICRNIKR